MNELKSYNEAHEMQRADELIADAIYDLEDEVEADTIQWLLNAWIMDDQGTAGLSMQTAAAREFDCSVPEWFPAWKYDTGDVQAIIRWLREQYPASSMTVYRGSSGRDGLPLESWTEDREIAQFYADRNGGTVVERTVSADEILTVWQSGFGLECAREVIVINR